MSGGHFNGGYPPNFAPSFYMKSIQFTMLTSQEVKRLSCKRITNPVTFDALLHPTAGGLYDPALGPSDRFELCTTCGLNYIHCPGHMGYIALPLPVFHPIFFLDLYQVLQLSCLACHHISVSPVKCIIFKGQMKLLEKGLISQALDLETLLNTNDTKLDSVDEAEKTIVGQVEAVILKAEEDGTISRWNQQSFADKSRNLTEIKRTLIGNFFHSANKSKCPRCQAPARKIRQEHQNQVFLRGMSNKAAGAWVSAANSFKAKTIQRDEESEETFSRFKLNYCTEQQFFSPLDAREHFRKLWDNDPILMSAIFSCMRIKPKPLYTTEDDKEIEEEKRKKKDSVPHNVDVFFLDTIFVSPSRFRPISSLGEKKFENSQTMNLQRILQDSLNIEEILLEKKNEAKQEPEEEGSKPKQSLVERLQTCWSNLQLNVNSYMDSDINKKMSAPNGIKQILEKKEGLFRKHMMGKRVNCAARSVISPDPNINMDEIGIPMVFATRLTYPEPVTYWNWAELRQAVINGPHVHPGATHVQNEDGTLVILRGYRQRQGIAKCLLAPEKTNSIKGMPKKVFRHLKNGDVLLLNRQPSLHKPSIMAHKARVLPGERTLRLHYANCKTYNADFDGDEMNAHFPQGELARAEAYSIVSTPHQYLVPKDGTPLSGLIQDHVVSGVILTLRDRFFTCGDYQKLLFVALPNMTSSFKLLPPCIWVPERLWTGKQVVSSLLLNLIPQGQDKLNLVSKSKISPKEWGRYCEVTKRSQYSDNIMTESEVIFREGQLLSGVLDKSQFGASQFGFVHSCFELYGGEMCNNLLSALGKLFTGFLQLHGFSMGVEDVLVKPEANEKRLEVVAEGRGCGPEAAAEAFVVKNHKDRDIIIEKYCDAHQCTSDDSGMKVLDYCMKKKTDQINNKINSVCIPVGLHKPFPYNSLQLMVQAGAKGSTVNCMQISCLLGQIDLEGRRPPIMLSGKSLPSFQPYDTCPRAGGFVDGRFLTSIQPQEFFLHCMAGREGLVDTAVKTSRSGYLQRCLIKHLEGITVHYDLTVRDSDGSIIQFLYGEDSLDIAKTRFLTSNQMNFLQNNYQSYLYSLNPQSAVEYLDTSKANKHQRKVDRWKKRHKDRAQYPRLRRGGFLDYYEMHLPEMTIKYPDNKGSPDFNYRTQAQRQVINSWYSSSPMLRAEMNDKYSIGSNQLPTISTYRPDRYFGSVPEKLTHNINQYLSKNEHLFEQEGSTCNSDNKPVVTADKFKTLVQFKCLRALVEPGEPVGLLAAQSIGEPSTQMTLNTFHFAGRGEMNVTLGIPRLREVLMTGSPNIKTPAMDVPLLRSLSNSQKQGEKLKKHFNRVLLKDVLDHVEVWETLERKGKGFCYRLYHIRLTFLDPKYYQDEYKVTPKKILQFVEESFTKKLTVAVLKEIKTLNEKNVSSAGVMADKELNPTMRDEETTPREEGDEDETDVSDVDEEDHAESSKQRSRKIQQVSYDAPDEEEELALSDSEEKTDKNEFDVNEEVVEKGPRPSVQNMELDSSRVEAAISSSSHVIDYIYDSENERWSQLTMKFEASDSKIMMGYLVERLANKVVVWEVPGIKKGFLTESQVSGEGGTLRLKTEGVNMQELWKHADVLDIRRAYTNNIHIIADTFGIEAAGVAIIKEVSSVFNVYGISVDHHHLSLIADYMTFNGTYKSFSRFAMDNNSSPLQQMSFETTMKFLRNATLRRDVDTLQSPSACLVTGNVVQGGTGSFECLQRLDV